MKWKTIHECEQWQIQVSGGQGNNSYQIVNVGPGGTLQFYRAFSGKYGEPLLEPEPDLAVPPPSGCTYINGAGEEITPDQKISGLICRGADGKVSLRVSLTNAKNKGIKWSLEDDGRVIIDGQVFFLYALVVKDKNRIRNYDAFFGPTPPEDQIVKVLELEDLI